MDQELQTETIELMTCHTLGYS